MLICNVHDKVIKIAQEIERFKERDFDDVKEVLDEIQSMAWDIRTLTEEAKEMGIKMESRLEKYYSAVTDLGFVRDKN